MKIRIEIHVKPSILKKINAKHGVDLYEVYEVLKGRFTYVRAGKRRYEIIGKTKNGRYLTIYVDKIMGFDHALVTARSSTEKEKRFYKREVEQ